MGQTNVNVRMDEELKQQFEIFCKEVGLNMTTAINVFAKKVVSEQRIPFELSVNNPNKETIEAIKEVENMKNNPQKYKGYDNVDDMVGDIL